MTLEKDEIDLEQARNEEFMVDYMIDVKFELEEREKVVDYIVGLDKQERDEFLAEIINQILKGTVKKR